MTPNSDAPAPTVRLSRIVPFLTLTVFLDLVGFGIILPLLPSYIRAMGGTPGTVGVLFASFAAAQLVATPILGRASDRYGRRRVITISLAANVVAMALVAVATVRHSLGLLFVARIFAGATSGNIGACQAAIADVSSGPERIKAMGKLGAGIGLGMMLGPWLGGRASHFGDAAPPLVAAAAAVLALAGVMAFLPETNAEAGRPTATRHTAGSTTWRWRAVMRSHPKIAVVMALYFLTFFYMTNLQTSLALLAEQRFHWDKGQLGDLFGLFGLVTLIVQFALVGPVSARLPPSRIVLAAGLVATAALLTIGLSAHASWMVVGLTLMATAVGFTQPVLAALASRHAGRNEQGLVLGVAQSSGTLGRAVGPLVWGALYDRLGPTASFVGGSIAAFGVALVSLGAAEAHEAPAPTRRSAASDEA